MLLDGSVHSCIELFILNSNVSRSCATPLTVIVDPKIAPGFTVDKDVGSSLKPNAKSTIDLNAPENSKFI